MIVDGIGDRIRAARIAAGITRTAAGRLAGVTATRWHHAEQGWTVPRLLRLPRYCAGIAVTMERLLLDPEVSGPRDVEAMSMRMRSCRGAIGCSLWAAGDGAGATDNSIRRWELGRSEPGISTMIRLADFYGVGHAWLAGWQ